MTMVSLLCFCAPRAHEDETVAVAAPEGQSKAAGPTNAVQTPKGYIKAMQAEQVSSSSSSSPDKMDVQTSWVSVANVSFADMLHAVEQKSLPERREPAQSAPAAPASQVEFPCLRSRMSETGEASCMWTPRPLAPVAEHGPPPSASSPAKKKAHPATACRRPPPVISLVAASNAAALQHRSQDSLSAVQLLPRTCSSSRLAVPAVHALTAQRPLS